MRSGLKIAGVAWVAALALAGCSTGDPASGNDGRSATTLVNCGREVTFDHEPERVVALGPSEVTTLYSAGAASKLVGRDDAGKKSDPYPPDIRAAVADVPQLGSGGEVTRENIIALNPDLVVGSVTETISPETLAAVGIPMISLSGNCGSNHAPGLGDGTADFDDVFNDVTELGRLLDTTDRSTAAVATMRQQVARAEPAAALRGRTAAAVIVFENSLEVYGRQSMAHTQFQALGLRDAFGDADSRVFEASVEQLVSRNPDVVMILSYGESDAQAKARFLRIPGASDLAAVRGNRVFVQPYEYSSQGTLSVTGLQNMSRALADPA